ncbi:AraC family transcriptional regulator [bacterium]|nr:MAG: AraC family transcriptional regulator [bacterium]
MNATPIPSPCPQPGTTVTSCQHTGHSLKGLRIQEQVSRAHRHHTPGQPNHHLMLLLESDGGWIRQKRNGKVFEGTHQAGDISIVPAHSAGHCHSEAHSRAISVQLSPAILTQVGEGLFDAKSWNLAARFGTRDETLKNLILLLHRESLQQATSGVGDDLMAQSLTTALAVHLLRQHAEEHAVMVEADCAVCGGLSLRAQRQVLEYVQDNLGDNVSLDGMAGAVGLSRYHFLRAFKVTFGLTPHQYVITQRVEKAKKFIRQNRFSLREISQLCGFGDQSHMTRQFHRLEGVTPKAFGASLQA